ncbi:MAG: PilZ domain-containing protein [Pseudomonadales bacterium]|nr:PilZ domain-containing protein [Pseudomonadales bacterium]
MAIHTLKKLLQKRRKSKRRLISNYIGVYDLEAEEFVGHLTNRSRTGLMITSTKAFEPSHTYFLGIQGGAFGSSQNLQTLEAKCLWARQESLDEFFTSGFKIDEKIQLSKKQLEAC